MIIRATDHCLAALEARAAGYDHCLVGAGIVGVCLAITLAEQGKRVLVLETGDLKETPALQAFYQGEASAVHPPAHEYRRQRLGGTSHLWGGRCIALDAQDFEARPHVPESGWPLTSADLAPYMLRAHEMLDVGAVNYSRQALQANKKELIVGLGSISPSVIENIERYSLPTDVGHKYQAVLQASQNILVIMRARVVDLELDAATQTVASAQVLVGESTEGFKVRAGEFVLCGGGIEATRLMLRVRQSQPSWARLDAALGKYYGCHFDTTLGELQISQAPPQFDFEKTVDGVYARRKLQFSREFQAKHGLLNAAFRLHFQPYANAQHGSAVLSTIYLLKSILPKEHQDILNHSRGVEATDSQMLAHLWNIARDLPSVPSFAWEWLSKIKLAHRKLPYTLIAPRTGKFPLEFNSEQVPSALNQIALSDRADKQGIPCVRIHWQLTDQDVASACASFTHLQAQLQRIKGVQLNLNLKTLEEQLQDFHPIGGHHLGSTRMGAAPNNSVVNHQLRVHGTTNLRIAAGSVFTTTGAANPTISLLAMVLRAFNAPENTSDQHEKLQPL